MTKRFFLLLILCSHTNINMAASKSHVIPSVIITKKKEAPSSLTSGPKTIISKRQISTSGVSSLSQVLQNLGGIQLEDTSGNGSQVFLSLRGFGANAGSNTLLLINGIPITNPDMAPPDLNAIPILEIESIEIISGSESVLYGDQAVGGTINIITHHPLKDNINLSCHGGSYNQHSCYALLNQHYKKINFGMTAGKNHTDNYRDHNDYNQDLLMGKVNHLHQNGHINFMFKYTNENMQYPGALTAIQVAQNRRQAINDIDFFKNASGFYHLQLQQILNENWNLQTDLVRRKSNGNGILFSPFKQSRAANFIKPQLNGKLNAVAILTGFDVESDQYRLDSTFSITTDHLKKYSGFILANIPYNSRLSFSIGARSAEQKSKLTSLAKNININRGMATTLGATYQLAPNTKLYLRRAGSFRFPKADENASTLPGTNGLRTQQGISYETGIEINRERYVGKAGIYQLFLKDEITFDPLQTPQLPFGANKNLDPTLRRGMTLSGNYTINPRVRADMQYNFVNSRFQSGPNKGKRIPLVSENILHAGLNYQFMPHWNLYSESIFTGNQFADNDDTNIHSKTGGYTVFNVNLRYQYLNFIAALHFNNIFNKQFYFYTVYQNLMQSKFFYPAPERNFTFTMNYEFI